MASPTVVGATCPKESAEQRQQQRFKHQLQHQHSFRPVQSQPALPPQSQMSQPRPAPTGPPSVQGVQIQRAPPSANVPATIGIDFVRAHINQVLKEKMVEPGIKQNEGMGESAAEKSVARKSITGRSELKIIRPAPPPTVVSMHPYVAPSVQGVGVNMVQAYPGMVMPPMTMGAHTVPLWQEIVKPAPFDDQSKNWDSFDRE